MRLIPPKEIYDEDIVDDNGSWDFSQVYDQKGLVEFFRRMLVQLEKGRFKIEAKEAERVSDGDLDIKLPEDQILLQVEYDLEEMVTEKGAKKSYLGIKVFWSDLGIERLIAEESRLEELENADLLEKDDDIEQAENNDEDSK